MPPKKEQRGPAKGQASKPEKRSPSPSGGSGSGLHAAGGHQPAVKRRPAGRD